MYLFGKLITSLVIWIWKFSYSTSWLKSFMWYLHLCHTMASYFIFFPILCVFPFLSSESVDPGSQLLSFSRPWEFTGDWCLTDHNCLIPCLRIDSGQDCQDWHDKYPVSELIQGKIVKIDIISRTSFGGAKLFRYIFYLFILHWNHNLPFFFNSCFGFG